MLPPELGGGHETARVHQASWRHVRSMAAADKRAAKDHRCGRISWGGQRRQINFRFSNRPVEVKHFRAIHRCSVDVSHGLALLFGIGTKALPSWDSKTRRNNLLGDLAVSVTAGSSGSTNSPHPSSREGT